MVSRSSGAEGPTRIAGAVSCTGLCTRRRQPCTRRRHDTTPGRHVNPARFASTPARTPASGPASCARTGRPVIDHSLNQSWIRIRAELRRAVTDSTWQLWLHDLGMRELVGDVLVLEAPDNVRGWV